MTLLTSEASIAALADNPPDVNANPGQGGPGGDPGNPGSPGAGGPAGSADCELWCAEHSNRHGSNGAGGTGGAVGRTGEPGPPPLSDALQVYPITAEQWDAAFNQPHILQVSPIDAEPGETVFIIGQNFIPGTDRVFFDGVMQPGATSSVDSATQAQFTVPLEAEGGTHPVRIRPAGATGRLSNRVMVRVLPKLDAIPADPRWVEGQAVTLAGLAFGPGCTVAAEDWSQPSRPSFNLPVTSSTRTAINLQIPPAPLGNLRGVRRIFVRNADGGRSRAERVARISDTIVVNVAAFRVVGTTPGVGTPRTDAEIAALFAEGAPDTLGIPWAQARVAFRFVQPVQTVTTDDANANLWPDSTRDQEAQFATDHGGLRGAINVYFFRDVEIGTAHAWFGSGPVFCGEEAGKP